VNDLIARDPDFNLQDLEDRASVMFWRRSAAERIGDVRPLRKIALADFCERCERDLKARSAGAREYFGECAVGSVDTLGLISDGQWDRALVEVRWAGTVFVVTPGDPLPRKTQRTTLTRMVLELSRRSGVKTDAGKAISSSHCPNCGAPESGRDDKMTGACEFCGAVLNDGTRGWVLSAIRTSAEAQQLLVASARDAVGLDREPAASAAIGAPATMPREPAISTSTMLVWMIQMALADGTIDPTERDMLEKVALRRNVPRTQLEAMIAAAQQGNVDLPRPAGEQETQRWLQAMAQEAIADGKMAPEELALLTSAGARGGLSDWDVQMLVKRVRADMYGAAQEALRRKRSGSGDGTT